MKSKLLLLAFLLLPFNIFATHIIGGTLEYTSLGGNQYQIHLVVYRDCFNGVPPFDSPAAIGLFDSSGTLITSYPCYLADSTTIFVQGGCIPGNICIRKANYYAVVTIPLAATPPVYIAYQRCCRSSTIINLFDPSNTGMTFYNTINTQIVNTSPVFVNEFAAFTYVGDNFSFDASAVDSDGDELVYSLDDAHVGASQIDPIPDPPLAPPYGAVLWQTPYSQNDMIGGPVPLTIDATTGIMTAVPGNIGIFVVSMKVDEYRNGNLIGTSRREFVLAVNPPSYFDGEGIVHTDNGTQLLDTGKSWLIRLNLLDSTLTAVDTNMVSNGNFIHPQVINGVYLIKGSADSVSPFYSSNLPTYYGDELFWYDATELDFCSGNVTGIDINLIQGVNPGGPGFIGGQISQGANRSSMISGSIEGITIILFDQLNQPVAYDITDATGNFGIGDLPYGSYKVYIDRLNYLVDNSIAPVITITPASPVLNNLSFLLHDTWLEHNGFVSIGDNGAAAGLLNIYPNPAFSQLFLNNYSSFLNHAYEIYNLVGETLQSGIVDSDNINISTIPSQVCILKIIGNNQTRYLKFVKLKN